MTQAPELRRARFHLLRAEDALSVVIACLESVPVPDSTRPGLIDHAAVIQQQLERLRALLEPPRPSRAA